MLNVIASLSLGAALAVAIAYALRSRRTPYHEISPSEIHPDLAAGEDLLHDALHEFQRETVGVTLPVVPPLPPAQPFRH